MDGFQRARHDRQRVRGLDLAPVPVHRLHRVSRIKSHGPPERKGNIKNRHPQQDDGRRGRKRSRPIDPAQVPRSGTDDVPRRRRSGPLRRSGLGLVLPRSSVHPRLVRVHPRSVS